MRNRSSRTGLFDTGEPKNGPFLAQVDLFRAGVAAKTRDNPGRALFVKKGVLEVQIPALFGPERKGV